MSTHGWQLVGAVIGAGISAFGSHIGTSYVGRQRVPGGSPWFHGQQLVRCFLGFLATAALAVWAVVKGRGDLALAWIVLAAVFVALARHYGHRLETMRSQAKARGVDPD
jgi:hypothetical protein